MKIENRKVITFLALLYEDLSTVVTDVQVLKTEQHACRVQAIGFNDFRQVGVVCSVIIHCTWRCTAVRARGVLNRGDVGSLMWQPLCRHARAFRFRWDVKSDVSVTNKSSWIPKILVKHQEIIIDLLQVIAFQRFLIVIVIFVGLSRWHLRQYQFNSLWRTLKDFQCIFVAQVQQTLPIYCHYSVAWNQPIPYKYLPQAQR